ncbi:DUF6245 family protein [Streptomyces sp. NPDC059650]|uniref:DUF6245 family protein n=1 Tax=Streptomyces sp. NPDC059650 TaxID=3346896 RepID=UPI0036A02748
MTSDGIPVTVEQISAALAALGVRDGDETPVGIAESIALGNADFHRLRLLNTLLGVVQEQAKLADEAEEDGEDLFTAWFEQLKAADAWDDAARQMAFLGWQVRRAGIPLYLIAKDPDAGAFVVAAAHAAEALHVMLGVIAVTDKANAIGDAATVLAQIVPMKAARELLVAALDNADIMLDSITSAGQ